MAELAAEALALLADEQADDALIKAREALEIFRKINDNRGIGDATRLLINALRQKLQPKEAQKVAKEELARFEEKQDARGKACMLLSLAEIKYVKHGSKGRDEALVYATEAVKLFKEVADVKMTGQALMMVSNVHISRGTKGGAKSEFARAQETAEESLTAFEKIGDKTGQARANHALSLSLCYQDDRKGGVECARESLAIWRELGIKKNEAFEQSCLARWLTEDKDSQGASEAACAAQVIWEELQYGKGYAAQAYAYQVGASLQEGDIVKARELANEALDKARDKDDIPGEAQALAMLYNVQMANQEAEAALDTADKAIKAVRRAPVHQRTDMSKLWESTMIQKVAWYHLQEKNLDEAMEYFETALALATEVGEHSEAANIMGMIAQVSIQQKNHDQAIRKANEMRDIYASKGNRVGEGYACLEVASVRAAQGNARRAIGSCRTALEFFEEGNDAGGQAEALFMMGQLQSHAEDFKGAMRSAAKAQVAQEQSGNKGGLYRHILQEAQAALGLAIQSGDDADWDTALQCGQATMQYASDLKDDSRLCEAMYNLGQVFVMMNNVSEAMTIIDQAMELCERTGDEVMEAYFSCLLAQLYIHQGNIEKAKVPINEAIDIFVKRKNEHGQKIAQDLLDKIMPKKKETRRRQEVEDSDEDEEAPAQLVAASAPSTVKVYKGPTEEEILEDVRAAALDLIGDDTLENDVPLMDAGLDSLAAVEFQGMLQKGFTGTQLPSTLVFDFPSARAISELLYNDLRAFEGL